jgi:hypothetical protein
VAETVWVGPRSRAANVSGHTVAGAAVIAENTSAMFAHQSLARSKDLPANG